MYEETLKKVTKERNFNHLLRVSLYTIDKHRKELDSIENIIKEIQEKINE